MSDHSPCGPRALLVSVGGSPNPILHSIHHHRPDHVWFFCSGDTLEQAEKIFKEIARDAGSWSPTPEFFKVDRFEELGPCYSTLRSLIPSLLEKWGVPARNVIIDYTGGTKTMSAALVLAAVELFDHFSYIGGEQRDKGGVGITLDGKERVHYQQNPWASLAIREVERAVELWKAAHFDAAADVLSHAAARVPQPRLFEAVSSVARGLAARHRLDFREANALLGPAARSLPNLLDGKSDYGLLSFVEHTAKLCGLCSKPSSDSQQTLLDELLDNTLRTAAQHRFEDAAARLYRCMEMQLQIWLEQKTKGLFKHGACKKIPAPWPPELQVLSNLPEHRHGGIKLGLEAIIDALHKLQDERVAGMVEDLKSNNPRLRDVAQTRNNGILAHGTSAVGPEGFANFKAVAAEFFGFDLERERNPIPPLDSRWLQFHTL